MNLFQGSRRILEELSAEKLREKQERFECLLTPIWNQLARYCHAVAGEHEAARDLMSETLLLAFQHFHQLRNEATFKSYLFRIASRVHHNWREKAARQTPLTDELAMHLEKTSLRDDGEAALRSLEVGELYEALKRLPEKQREAIVLFEISGLSLKEVGEVQGGTLSGVKTRIVRGREALAIMLGARKANVSSATSREATNTSTTPAGTMLAARILAFSVKARL
jgi:RNA polymerase sigma-70 factor (ECF subfamily)